MRLSIISLVFVAVGIVGADDTASSTESYNLSDLQDKLTSLQNLLPSVPADYTLPASVTSLANELPTPPPNMLTDILQNVPASVLSGLMNPASRSALEKDFNDGNYPSWWVDLPTGVKSYFSAFAAQMTQASLTYHPEGPMATGGASLNSSGGGTNSDGLWNLSESDNDKSSAMAIHPSRAVSASVLVALGILGIALAL